MPAPGFASKELLEGACGFYDEFDKGCPQVNEDLTSAWKSERMRGFRHERRQRYID